MRHHLNTLFISTQGSWVFKDGKNVVVKNDGEVIGRVPIHLIESVVCIGQVSVSAPLLGFCAESGVTVVYLDRNGRFQARVEGPVAGNMLLRKAQYLKSEDDSTCKTIVATIVAAKVHNQRALLRRSKRDHGDANGAITQSDKLLSRLLDKLPQSHTVDQLRGYEGDAARMYFECFPNTLRGDGYFTFNGRSRRPPRDAINALLSFTYVLLTNDCRSALETVGLDPACGYLHKDRPGRPSLALDVSEEFRAPLAERLCLSLVNRKQLNKRHFTIGDAGAVMLNDDGRKIVIEQWQKRKSDEVTHAFMDAKMPMGTVIHAQAILMARHLRGDIDAYVPYLTK